MVKRMKTTFANHGKRIASSHDSWHSSNSARLNQDILSAKIDSAHMDGPPDIRMMTNQGNSSDS